MLWQWEEEDKLLDAGLRDLQRDRLPEVVATLNASVGVLLLALGKGLTPRRASRSWEGVTRRKLQFGESGFLL